MYVRWVIETNGIPIGFFEEQTHASIALSKHVEQGVIKRRELHPYNKWVVEKGYMENVQ